MANEYQENPNSDNQIIVLWILYTFMILSIIFIINSFYNKNNTKYVIIYKLLIFVGICIIIFFFYGLIKTYFFTYTFFIFFIIFIVYYSSYIIASFPHIIKIISEGYTNLSNYFKNIRFYGKNEK